MSQSNMAPAAEKAATTVAPATTETDPVVELKGITKRFGKVTALDDVSLTVERGEFLTLLGPSGCGKTTLLRIIAGFETPTSGAVWVTGKDVTHDPPERRPLNMAFQRYALFPHLNIADNIAFGLRIKHVPEPAIRDKIRDALALVRLEGLELRMPNQISGGQAQRVALARALVNEPQVLLLDEPLSALDRKIRHQMQSELRAIQSTLGTTFVYVTHDQEEAMSMSTRIALMCDGQITQLASPWDLYMRPACQFAADFVGDANLLRAKVAATPCGQAVELSGFLLDNVNVQGRAEGEPIRLVVRPEAIQVYDEMPADSSSTIMGTIVASSFYGFFWMHRIQIGDQELSVRELKETPTTPHGQQVWLEVDTNRVVVLPASEEA